ncbi:hypothetical protein ACWEQP_16470 [Streptomyces sp. NPDC004044]
MNSAEHGAGLAASADGYGAAPLLYCDYGTGLDVGEWITIAAEVLE